MTNHDRQEQLLAEFEAEHGEVIWNGQWGVTRDGCEAEAGTLGLRFLTVRPPERQQQVKILYWRWMTEILTRQFHDLKDRLENDADFGTLKPDDTSRLKELKREVQHAAKMLDTLENPPGPDPAGVRRARKLYLALRELAGNCKAAERRYHTAKANRKPSKKLGQQWEEAYVRWEEVNRAYQGMDVDVRKAAEGQVYREEHEAKVAGMQSELESIEI